MDLHQLIINAPEAPVSWVPFELEKPLGWSDFFNKKPIGEKVLKIFSHYKGPYETHKHIKNGEITETQIHIYGWDLLVKSACFTDEELGEIEDFIFDWRADWEYFEKDMSLARIIDWPIYWANSIIEKTQ